MAWWLSRQSHGVSALLNRMEGEGLVKRVKDLERKNQVRVVMTRKGQKTYLELVAKDPIHRVMSSLSVGERQRMRSNLLKIRDTALEELRVDTKPLYPTPLSV
jgi:DNA-binding MarR family transcriptional regulator